MKQFSAEFSFQKFEYQISTVFRTQPKVSDGIFCNKS